jgi:hypothetical protein
MEFATGTIENGQLVVTNKRTLSQGTIQACPNVIFDPDHYHDNTCDCFDQSKEHMAEWGYTWDADKGHWSS